MDTAEWPQEVMVKAMEDKISKTCSSSLTAAATNNSSSNHHKAPLTSVERKIRPQKDEAVNCPRCNSGDTKFCYYNNYSLTQPRYLCKTCKRYWTEGGSLRNIPVGGGSRKNKRSSSSSSSTCTSPASKRLSSHDLVAATQSHHLMSNPNNNNNNNNSKMMMMSQSQSQSQQAQDLNLGFPPTQLHQDYASLSQLIQLPSMGTTPHNHNHNDNHNNPSEGQELPSTSTGTSVDHLSAFELLNGLTSSRGLTPFMHMGVQDPNDNGGYSSGYPSLQELKPSMNFSLDSIGQDHDNKKEKEDEESGRDENGDSSSSSSNGFWNGMLGSAGE